MVRDGIYYAAALSAAGVLLSVVTWPWTGIPLFVLAAFCLYFFRDPERVIPAGPVAVSPADGKVVGLCQEAGAKTRISIFLNIFDVHVNRAPIGGVVSDVRYRKGRVLVASNESASAENEPKTLTAEGS